MKDISISEIRDIASSADEKELNALERSLAADPRIGVAKILASARKRIAEQSAEDSRLASMYSFERELCGSDTALCVGLDEVGRGPIAGPLAVGAVVLPQEPKIPGLNDSKKLSEMKRTDISSDILSAALASTVVFVDGREIDELGIIACLKRAFIQAIKEIEDKIGAIDHVLLDGNPLHIDSREINVVKGDGKCASIAAASIIAKVARDAYMREMDEKYPQYCFSSNKGYGTNAHISAIKEHGLCEIHRHSFCSGIVQETLF